MNKLVLSFAILAALAVHAEELAPDTVTVTAEDVMTEAMGVIQQQGWTAADVADAIKSVRELYVRDNATTDGRKRWNGPVVETRVDTNAMTKTTIHENGRVFVDEAKIVTPAQSVAAANKRLKTTVTTNGVPAALAAARLRRAAEISQGVSNVTQTVTAGGK